AQRVQDILVPIKCKPVTGEQFPVFVRPDYPPVASQLHVEDGGHLGDRLNVALPQFRARARLRYQALVERVPDISPTRRPNDLCNARALQPPAPRQRVRVNVRARSGEARSGIVVTQESPSPCMRHLASARDFLVHFADGAPKLMAALLVSSPEPSLFLSELS